jgi:hypothetical protein
MAYIFLDESGDLGFDFQKKKTTQFFVITCLFINNKKPVEKLVKKIHSGLKNGLKRRIGVLHAVAEKPITRQRILRGLLEKDCKIMTIYLNKKKVYTKLQDEKQVLYNFVSNILLDRIYSKKIIPTSTSIELVASRRETNKFLNENFKKYIKSKISYNHKIDLSVQIKTPFEEKALQMVDFASWAIFRKYEHKDDSYYNIIKEKIFEESPLFP